MRDFLAFRRMLMPILIQIIFWLGVVVCIMTAISDFTNNEIFLGILVLIIGPIMMRLACELCVVFFRMNETLTDISESLRKR